MTITFTGISARLKGNYAIELTATGPDEVEQTVRIDCDDIHEIYGQTCAAWMEANGDNEAALWELFAAVAGIYVTA
jgi:hypothetical protein